MRTKKIETISDVRYKAHIELRNFIDWFAETHPELWNIIMEEYKSSQKTERIGKSYV